MDPKYKALLGRVLTIQADYVVMHNSLRRSYAASSTE